MKKELTSLKKNPPEFLKNFYIQYRIYFYQFAKKYEVHPIVLPDLYITSFIVLREHASQGKLDGIKGSIKTYFYYISKFIIYDYLLQKEIPISIENLEDFKNSEPITIVYDPPQLTIEQLKLLDHFKSLGVRCQEMLCLFYYKNLSLDEVTRTLDHESPQMVNEQKLHCLKSLKDSMNHSETMDHGELFDGHEPRILSANQQITSNPLNKETSSIKTDSFFSKDLTLICTVEGRTALRKILQDFESTATSKPSEKNFLNTYKYYIIIFTLILIITILASRNLFTVPLDLNTDKLYNATFEPYKNVVTQVIKEDRSETGEVAAFISYKNNEYTLAASQFETVFKNTDKTYLLLYQANALMADNRVAEAIPILEKHVASRDLLSDRGKWYLALAYLKIKKKEKAITLLEAIERKKAFKSGAAFKLLKELRILDNDPL